jgi:hypothetical protein
MTDRSRGTVSAICIALLVGAACFRFNRVHQDAIPVPGPTFEAKHAYAVAFANGARYARMQARVRQRFPNVTERDASNLMLQWKFFKPLGEGEGTVDIIVGIANASSGVDSAAVVAECRKFVEEEMRAAPH